jgi:ferredoxin-like protein FixX
MTKGVNVESKLRAFEFSVLPLSTKPIATMKKTKRSPSLQRTFEADQHHLEEHGKIVVASMDCEVIATCRMVASNLV